MLRRRIDGLTKFNILLLVIVPLSHALGQIDVFPPIARDDSQSTLMNVNVTILVTENDNDPDLTGGIDLESIDLDPGKDGRQDSLNKPEGRFKATNAGTVTFEPKDDVIGTATATYTVKDESGKTSNIATITVTITEPPNVAPTAVNDNSSTAENIPVTITVTANDTDSDGTINVATVDLNTSEAGIQTSNTTVQGTFSVNTSGAVTFTPLTDFVGTASITYTVNDNDGATSNSATINITVTATPNIAPVAANDTGNTTENSPITINVVTNDADSDGSINPATVDLNTTQSGIQTSVATPQGSFTVNGSGIVTYAPATDFSGTASASYTVNDNEGATSNTATISISVSAIANAAPIATNDASSTTEGSSITINVVANDTDSDGSINAGTVDLNTTQNDVQSSNTTPQGAYTVNNSGVVTYTPASGFSGTASLNYTVNDNEGATSNVATISVSVSSSPNSPPVATNDAASTTEDTPVTVNVTANDTDSDGTINAATVDLNTNQSGIQSSQTTPQGSFAVNASGIVTYTPASSFSGNAPINYTVNDNEGATSNSATITINVSATENTAPVATNDAASTSENSAVTINVVSNDTDDDGSINAGTVDLNTTQNGIQTSVVKAQGTFSVNASGVVTFTPAAGYSGSASNKYTVNDNEGATSNAAEITITVSPLDNKAPTAANDAATTNENTIVTIDVTANDTDSDGTINKATVDLNTTQSGIQISNSNAQGSYSVASTGVVSYTPIKDFSGVATINYIVNDNEGAKSNAATITITVTATNSAPVAVPDNTTTESNVAVQIAVLSNDTDSDGTVDPNSIDLNPTTSGVQKRVDIPAGVFETNFLSAITYTPTKDFFGTASIAYTVKDNEGTVSNAAAITVEVREVVVAEIDIPSGFTPNGDGANETWKILSKSGSRIELPLAVIKVFDKRGVLVYDAHGLEKPWDGKHNGKALPADSYYYIIDLKPNGKTYKGVVTILTNRP